MVEMPSSCIDNGIIYTRVSPTGQHTMLDSDTSTVLAEDWKSNVSSTAPDVEGEPLPNQEIEVSPTKH